MRIYVALAACGLFLLAGCSGGTINGLNEAGTQASGRAAGAKLTGVVHGGQQPIVGAQVYLFAAGTTGYGGAGITATSSNASASLLTSGSGATLDTSVGTATSGDYYVTTDSGGNFSITGDYTCTTGQQVYLYALGGNPGSGTNSAAGLMAVLGSCPVAGNFATTTPYVVVNEVSTVAAAYALAGFATDAAHVGSSGTTLAQVGIANAFANAANLETLGTGVALATTPAANGTVPQATINTLANILASCVNSTGAASSSCSTLLTNTLSGGASGVAPTDTATAAINIAHNPGVGTTALYGLGTSAPPFGPALTAQPSYFAIFLTFTGGGLSTSNAIAIDGSGNAWVANTSSDVSVFSSAGAALSPSTGYTGGGLSNPTSIAIDPSGNAWVANNSGNSVTELSSSGLALSGSGGFTGGGMSAPSSIAIDGSGDAWVEGAAGTLIELSNSGTILSGVGGFPVPFQPGSDYLPYSTTNPNSLAIDGGGNVWVTSGPTNSVYEVSSSGTNVSGTSGYTGISDPLGVAIDGSGHAWVSDVSNGSYYGAAFSSSGSVVNGPLSTSNSPFVAIDGSGGLWFGGSCVTHVSLSPVFVSFGYCGQSLLTGSAAIAIDGSGNVWLPNGSSNYVTEWVGAATPVVTPLSVGVENNTLGARP